MAENLNVTRTLVAEAGDGADRARLPDHADTKRRPERTRGRLSAQGWVLVTVLAGGASVALLWWLYQQWAILDLQAPALTFAVRVLLLVGLPLLVVLGLAQWLWARSRHALITRLENDHPVSVSAVLSGRLPAAESLAAFYQVQGQWAQHSGLRSLNQLDMSSTKAPEKPAEPAALPAPDLGNRLTFDAFWQRLEDAAHIGLFGMSQSGKSTLGRALLNAAVERGEQVMVISLAADRVDWPVPAIGAAGEPAIVQAIAALRAELKRRENEGERHARPIRVFVDELTSATADKAVYAAWEQMMAAFMTRSRHVGMFLVVMAHDNTSGVFATTGKARLIKNFLQVWCVREQGRRLVRIDDGLTLDASGRQVRQVWQLDDTAPIAERASRRVHVPPDAIFLTEADLRPTTPTTEDAADLLVSYLRRPSYASYADRSSTPDVVDDTTGPWACPFCEAPLRNRQQFSIAHRYGWCDACRPDNAAA